MIRAGNLYYEQAVYNYNKAFEMAQIVQWGPAFCPDGYEITSEGIPNGCTDYKTLVEECNKDIFWDGALKLLTDTMKLAAGLVQPTKNAAYLFKSFNFVANLVTGSTNLLGAGYYHLSWDPNTEMPPLPPDGSDAEEKYADGCYEWYLDGQKSLSDSLKVWSPARWDAIYLENKKQYGPSEFHLVSVSVDVISEKVSDYLLFYLNIKSFTQSSKL